MARRKGAKRLQTTNRGTKINQYGVRFTPSEQQELKRLVQASNRKRNKIITQAEKIAPPSYLKYTKPVVFAPRKASQSLNRFKSREEFNAYMASLRKVSKPNFVASRVALYKKNVAKALRNVFGSEVTGLIRKIKQMTDAQFQSLTITHAQDFNIDYIYYDPENNKLRELNRIADQVLQGG